MTILEAYNKGKNILKSHNSQTSVTDTLCIFKKCFNMERHEIFINKNNIVEEKKCLQFLEMINKRKTGYPVQYIIEQWEFMGMDLKIGKGVLIPRDDTEVLVNSGLNILKTKNIKSPLIIDLCAGAGTIALSLERLLNKTSHIVAIEISEYAYAYLKENTTRYGKNTISIMGDILECHKMFNNGTVDAIFSNPPYIPSDNINNLQDEVKIEPRIALDGGNDGLKFFQIICNYWIKKLKYDGFIAVEVGIGQARDVLEMFKDNGLTNIDIKKDINGIERVVIGHKLY